VREHVEHAWMGRSGDSYAMANVIKAGTYNYATMRIATGYLLSM